MATTATKPKEKTTFTHDELASDLASHFRAPNMMVWENMQMGPNGSCRPDVFTMRKSFSNPQPRSYEIKISTSDFRSDTTSGKWEKYLEFSSGVVFACPKGLVSKSDIPPTAGLIVRSQSGWRMVKKPMQSAYELSTQVMLKMLIDGINRHHEQRENYTNHHYSPKLWQADKKAKRAIGQRYGKIVAEFINDHEAVYRQIKNDIDDAERLKISASDRLSDAKTQVIEIYKEAANALMVPFDEKNPIWNIKQALKFRIRAIQEGDELSILRDKFKKLEKIHKNLFSATNDLGDDFWLKDI